MSAKANSADSVRNRTINTADDARGLEEGDRLEISYVSTLGHGGEKTITATVDREAISDDVELGRVYLHSDEENDRRPCYENGSPDRHLEFVYDDIELKMENGTRWQRLSEIATNPEVKLME